MHVCKDYVTDSCSNGATCHWNHSFHNGKDRVWLSRIKLDQFIEEELRWLVLTSTPQICAEYNNGICQDGSSCTRIHTCIAYLLRRCKASGCGLSHEETMRSEQNRAVLDWYQVTDLDSGYLDQLILMNEEPVKKGDTANSKVRICNSIFPQTQGIPTRLLQVPKPKAKLSQAVLSQSQIFSRAAPWMLKKSNRHCGHGPRYPLSHFYRRGKVTSSHFSFNEVLTVNKSSRTKSARELLARERFFKSPCIRTVHLC